MLIIKHVVYVISFLKFMQIAAHPLTNQAQHNIFSALCTKYDFYSANRGFVVNHYHQKQPLKYWPNVC